MGDVAGEHQRAGRRRREEAPRIGHQDDRPEVLARVAGRGEVGAVARRVQLPATEAEPHSVFVRPPDAGEHFTRRRVGDDHSPLGEIRLAARADPVAKVSSNFLGDPHHPFPKTPKRGCAGRSHLNVVLIHAGPRDDATRTGFPLGRGVGPHRRGGSGLNRADPKKSHAEEAGLRTRRSNSRHSLANEGERFRHRARSIA